MEETTSVLDTFSLCWNAIETESKRLNCKFDGKNDVHDSRDANFEKAKTRLDFIYKYGCFNIELVAKCISNFLVECASESENIFPLENLKVCSFSNGPGLDIVGLLCALYKPEKTWKYFPVLKAVNLHDSWLNMYNLVVREAYEKIFFKSHIECHEVDDILHVFPSENIQLIQNNIYGKISPEAETFISESNILLMVNIFVSSKPTVGDSFNNILEKILSLLKPGALIFLVGTKCIKKFLNHTSLNESVKCVFGPKKITVENFSFDETIVNAFKQKPLSSGKAHFFVWQKKEVNVVQIVDKSVVPAPTIDSPAYFTFCWNAILAESKQFNNTLFEKKHCNVLDSRDANFVKVENRLAYIYKYGYFNIQFFEKCISNFIFEVSEFETVFPLENLRVCSLSNGPGLDIIGLFYALNNSKKTLKHFPQLKAVNLHDTWLNMYKMLVQRSCEALYFESHDEYFKIPSDNILFTQSDIYATISPEAEKFISESNVLLMYNTFLSSKATGDTCTNTLKKIFSLLKPRTLIFFVGTKQNKEKISEDACLKNIVKCIFGPKTVTLEDLPPNDTIIPHLTVNVKLQYSRSAYFIVWQRREIDDTFNIMETKEQKALKSVENTMNDEDELSNVTDAGSEKSPITCSKQTESLYDELKIGSLSNDSDINDKFSEKESQNSLQNCHAHSSSSITSIVSGLESISDNVEDSNTTGKMNFNECLQPSIHHLISKSGSNSLGSSIQEKNLASNEVQVKSETTEVVYPLNKATKKKKNKRLRKLKKSLKKYISSDIVNPETSFTNDDTYQKISMVSPPVIQNDVHKAGENTPNKNRNNIVQANIPPVNQSHEDIYKFPRNMMDTQNCNNSNSSDFQKIIERCDSLVTSLEEMTADIKRNLNRKHDQVLCCGVREVCRKFIVPHCSGLAGCNNKVFCSLCMLSVQLNCCRKACKCNIKNVCINSLPCRNCIKE